MSLDRSAGGVKRAFSGGLWPRALLALALLIPCAAMARLGGFDGLYGQDAFAYFDYAVGPLRESLLARSMPPPFFWPPGYPLVVAAASLVVGASPLTAQAVSLVAGALVPLLTALLAAEVWPAAGPGECGQQSETDSGQAPRRLPASVLLVGRSDALVPLVAGLLVALTGQLWQSSVVVMADTLGLAAATAGALGLARYAGRGRLRWLALGAAGLAFAVSARWIYGLVAAVCALFALSALRRGRPGAALAHCALAAGVAALVGAPLLIPLLDGLFRDGPGLAPFAGNFRVYWWDPLNAFRRDFATADGHLSYRLPNGLYYALAPAHPLFFTPLLAAFIPLGLWAARQRRHWRALALLGGWAAVVWAFHAGAAWQNLRFTLAYLPPLAVLAAIGIAWTWDRLRARWARRLLAMALLVGLGAMAAGGARLTESFIARKQADLATVAWVERGAPAGGRLLTFNLTATFQHYSRLPTADLSTLDRAALDALAADPGTTLLLLDTADVEGQWRGMPPWTSFHRLLDDPGLTEVGRRADYTLFRLGRLGP